MKIIFSLLILLSIPTHLSAGSACSIMAEKPTIENECVVCLERVPNIIFEPCRHKVTCNICAPEIKTCPFCREEIIIRKRAKKLRNQ